jgi:hypothetical protein
MKGDTPLKFSRLAYQLLAFLLASGACNAFAQATPAATTCDSVPGIERFFAPGGIVMVGEGHGTNEMPAMFARIVCLALQSKQVVAVGLELFPDQREAINTYLASNGDAQARQALLSTKHWTAARDGRSSVGYLNLVEQLRVLRQRGEGLTVFCLYEDLKSAADFALRGDQIMADRIRKEHVSRPDALILTFTGNYHSKLKLPESWSQIKAPDGRSLPKPMGEVLADVHPISIDLESAGGAAWVCLQSGCGIHEVAEPPQSSAGPLHTIGEPEDNESYTARINVGKVTASIPAADKFR